MVELAQDERGPVCLPGVCFLKTAVFQLILYCYRGYERSGGLREVFYSLQEYYYRLREYCCSLREYFYGLDKYFSRLEKCFLVTEKYFLLTNLCLAVTKKCFYGLRKYSGGLLFIRVLGVLGGLYCRGCERRGRFS